MRRTHAGNEQHNHACPSHDRPSNDGVGTSVFPLLRGHRHRSRLPQPDRRPRQSRHRARTHAAHRRQPHALQRALAATDWADALVADGAKVLAQYRHPHFGPWAAVTTTEHRKGRITVVGTVPGQELAAAIARWLAPEPVSGWTDTPESVTVSSADGPGGRVFTVHNWSWEPASVPVPTAVRDLLGDAELAPGEPVQLGPWDVRILTSTTTPDGGTIQ